MDLQETISYVELPPLLCLTPKYSSSVGTEDNSIQLFKNKQSIISSTSSHLLNSTTSITP